VYLGFYLGSLEAYSRFIESAAWLYDVPEDWIRAVIDTESSGNPNAYRYEAKLKDASYGLMQILYSTAKGLGYVGPPAGLYDPSINIDLGARLLRQLRDRYGDDFSRVYSAYNSGRPDLYLTSTQVATNVERALSNLAKYATAAAATVYQYGEPIVETAAGAAADFPAGLVLVGLAAVLLARKRR
jgi:soluble lytic murein transglycosylase-like protein